MWVSEALVASDSSAWGRGCANGTVSTKVALMAVKDSCMAADHSRTFGLPLSAPVSSVAEPEPVGAGAGVKM